MFLTYTVEGGLAQVFTALSIAPTPVSEPWIENKEEGKVGCKGVVFANRASEEGPVKKMKLDQASKLTNQS